ncbi:MAG: DUF1456 family protein [Lentisphaeraceae bacterium]|nr:DUF1456 family protein [Lentisphaeraceae bacterium]
MNKNDILIRIRYAFHFKNAELIEMFKLGGCRMEALDLVNLLKKEEEEGFWECEDKLLDSFLDGFIIKKRGKQEPKPGQKAFPKPDKLTNNIILKKIRIALELKDTDILEILETAKFKVSKTELSALFRREGQRNYKECGNQFLRNFLVGLALKYRPI